MRKVRPRLATLAGVIAMGASVVLAGPRADYASQFKAAVDAKDSSRCEKILQAWEKREPDNPAYYIAAANYYYRRAVSELHLSTNPAAKGDFVLANPKTGPPVGSISGGPDPVLAERANALLKTANAKFPKRLDIWLGRAQLHEAFGQSDELVDVLRDLGACVRANPADLLGLAGPYPEPVRANLARKYSGFAARSFDRKTGEGDRLFFAIATVTAEYFPDTVFGHNLLGNYYAAISANPERAIECYRKALAVDAADSLVWSNLAEICCRTEKFDDAREAIGKVLELNNDAASVAHASKLMASLPPK